MSSGEPARTPLRRLTSSHYVEFSRLGEGSMGLVYLALDTELNRRVAFKMIRPLVEEEDAEPLEATPSPEDEAFPELKARFLQEAWVTGGLEHPGIVPVYELGETTGGIPYYTMRVVRGERTLADAIEQAEGLDGRLALLEPFLKICDTVRYAHARGVIHRDLKPANIALGDYGETVVLDWGLAKLKDRPDLARSVWQSRIEELRSETDLETLASAIGTPGYMSPEAALVEIDKVDARSDVYSLGAILYRILTGRLPYEFQSYPELVQKLTTKTPRDPTEVDPAVPTGLSRICLKALSAEREARYADADEVAAAIRAWQRESALEREVASLLREAESALETAPNLAGEALLRQVDRVTAVCARILDLRPGHEAAQGLQVRGHQLRERAIVEREQGARKRLLKRVAVVGLATATAATVIVALLLDARRREAEEARTREAQARTRAEQERARAEDLARFMLVDLRDGLEPIGRLDLLSKVARKSKEYYDTLPTHEMTVQGLRPRQRAFMNVGDVLKDQGDLAAALDSFRAAHALALKLVALEPSQPDWRLDLCVTFNRIAAVLQAQGDLKGALVNLREAAAIDRRLVAQDPSKHAWRRDLYATLSSTGTALLANGQQAKALEICEEALIVIRGLTDSDPSNLAWRRDLSTAHNNIAVIQSRLGNVEAAQHGHEEALAIVRKLVHDDPANAQYLDSLASNHRNLGGVLSTRGDWTGALRHLREAIATRRRLSENDPTNTTRLHLLADALTNLGDLQAQRGDWRGLDEVYREALEIRKRLCALDPSNQEWQLDLCKDLSRSGDCRLQDRDLEGAELRYREANALARNKTEAPSPDPSWFRLLLITASKLGGVRHALGDADGALDYTREALAVSRRYAGLGPEDPDRQRTLSISLSRLGSALRARNAPQEALKLHLEATAICERLVALDPKQVTWQLDLVGSMESEGMALRAMKRFDEAAEKYRASTEISRSLVRAHPTNAMPLVYLGTGLYNLGLVLENHGKLAAAVTVLREAADTLGSAAKLAPQWASRQRIVEQRYRRAALLAGEQAPRNAEDSLLLAIAHSARKDHSESARHYAVALEDAKVRADLNRFNLYNGACAAALASAALEGEEAAQWRTRALEWLGEDLRRRREILAQIDEGLAGDAEPERRARLEKQRQSFLAHSEHARVKDPDIASLRGTPEFEALFEEKDDAQ